MGCVSSKTTDYASHASGGGEPVKATPVKATEKTAEGASEFREVSLSPKSGGGKKATASEGGSSTPLAKPKAAVDEKLVHEMSEAVTSVKAKPAATKTASGVKNIPKPKPIANAENGGPPLEKSKTQRKNERRRQREKQKKAEEKQANAMRAMSGLTVSVDRDLY